MRNDLRQKIPFIDGAASWFASIDAAVWVWVLVMICVPIARWMVGDTIIPVVATVTTLLQFTAVTVILCRQWGARRTLITFAIVAVLTYSAEALGSKTDFPFGAYDYTPILQPQVWGVPLLIPLAWWMMIVPAWGVAAAIVDSSTRRTFTGYLAFILISAAAITAWDLFLDPQMVGWGFWVWDSPSGYFGIPFVNFFGWMLTAAVVTAVVRPSHLPITPLLVVYSIVWILQSIGLAFFWGQPGPALFGFIAMGALLALALYRRGLSRD